MQLWALAFDVSYLSDNSEIQLDFTQLPDLRMLVQPELSAKADDVSADISQTPVLNGCSKIADILSATELFFILEIIDFLKFAAQNCVTDAVLGFNIYASAVFAEDNYSFAGVVFVDEFGVGDPERQRVESGGFACCYFHFYCFACRVCPAVSISDGVCAGSKVFNDHNF